MRTVLLLTAVISFGCDQTSSSGGNDMATNGSTDLANGANHDLSFPPGTDLAGADFAIPPGADLAISGHLQSVFVIVMENNNWASIKGSTHAPYINGLLPVAAHAEMYKNPAGIHPSEPDYLWLEAGTNFGITADGDPAGDHQSSTAHLVTQLEAAGISWKSYQEDIDGITCPLTGVK